MRLLPFSLSLGLLVGTVVSTDGFGDKGQPDERRKVEQAIEAWRSDIIQINNFVDSGRNFDGGNKAGQAAVDASRDEIVQLEILAGVSHLDKEGQEAAKRLEHDLPEEAALLEMLVNGGRKGHDNKDNNDQTLDRLNNLRCNSILPDTQTLWDSASDAVDAKEPEGVPFPNACNKHVTVTKTRTRERKTRTRTEMSSTRHVTTTEKNERPTRTEKSERPTRTEDHNRPTRTEERETKHETERERPTRSEDHNRPTRTEDHETRRETERERETDRERPSRSEDNNRPTRTEEREDRRETDRERENDRGRESDRERPSRSEDNNRPTRTEEREDRRETDREQERPTRPGDSERNGRMTFETMRRETGGY